MNENKNLALGIEFGSTRIKLILIDDNANVIAKGSYSWKNKLKDNRIWTYDLKDAINGLQVSYKELKDNYFKTYNEKLTKIDAIGISGMMHGYLVFDKDFNQLAEFRTWRNTITSEASEILTKEFNFPIPQRWCVAHIYQAILNNEPEIKDIRYATTLSGYMHYMLSNEFCLGIGDASGAFPIDEKTGFYDKEMLAKFNKLVEDNVPFKIEEILPKVLKAGKNAGVLTIEGAKLIDPEGDLMAGSLMVPPEGDMGTGMVATNSLRLFTGNASFGTSSNVTIITGKKIKVCSEIDQIVTPDGNYAALVHVNNGTNEIDVSERLFKDLFDTLKIDISHDVLYETLFKVAVNKESKVKDIVAVDYVSGEPITHLLKGQPLTIRRNGASYNLSTFMRMHIYSLFATIYIGIKQLENDENIKTNLIVGHGGFFKTKNAGDVLFASSLNTKIRTFENAGEGGPFGMALLAKYGLNSNIPLPDFLDKIFESSNQSTVEPDEFFKEEFEEYIELYKDAIEVEKFTVNKIK